MSTTFALRLDFLPSAAGNVKSRLMQLLPTTVRYTCSNAGWLPPSLHPARTRYASRSQYPPSRNRSVSCHAAAALSSVGPSSMVRRCCYRAAGRRGAIDRTAVYRCPEAGVVRAYFHQAEGSARLVPGANDQSVNGQRG